MFLSSEIATHSWVWCQAGGLIRLPTLMWSLIPEIPDLLGLTYFQKELKPERFPGKVSGQIRLPLQAAFSCVSAQPAFGTLLPTRAERSSETHHLRVTTRALGCAAHVMTEIDLTHSFLQFINTVPDLSQCRLSLSTPEKQEGLPFQSLPILQIRRGRGADTSVEAQCQDRYVSFPATHLHPGVVCGRRRRSSVGLDVLFEQTEPQVHLSLVGAVDDDGIKADTCDTFRNGRCHSSLFSFDIPLGRYIGERCPQSSPLNGLRNTSNKS